VDDEDEIFEKAFQKPFMGRRTEIGSSNPLQLNMNALSESPPRGDAASIESRENNRFYG